MNSSHATIHLAKGQDWLPISISQINRHLLIAGATGTGKTITLQVLIEALSKSGVPVLVSDVKGDLAGLSQPIDPSAKIHSRIEQLGLSSFKPGGRPIILWDVFGESGHPLRTTVSEMGSLLLARILGLNEVQSGVLDVVFELSDREGLLLLDLKDLRSLLELVIEKAPEIQRSYGNVSRASVGAIQRSLLSLEQQGGESLFGEPALLLADLMRTDKSGQGVVSILAADRLFHAPKIYATVLLWLLGELFEQLPEVGELDQPKLVVCFDEAHLLFDGAPDVLIDKVEQVVRLIRSRGIGIVFITQHPLDLPERVLSQIGSRVQHALRAFSPKEQQTLKAVASGFRTDDPAELVRVLQELVPGEAIVSFLGDDGAPQVASRAMIVPPESRIGVISETERYEHLKSSPVGAFYDRTIDRHSAYEELKRRREQGSGNSEKEKAAKGRQRQGAFEAFIVSTARSIGSQIGRHIFRGVLGSITGKRG